MSKRGPNLRVFRNSELGTWLDCRQMWWFAFVEQLDTAEERFYFRFGTAFHAACQALWMALSERLDLQIPRIPGRDFETLALEAASLSMQQFTAAATSDEARQEAADGWEILRWAVPNYVNNVFLAGDSERYEPVMVEREFLVPVLDAKGRSRHLMQKGTQDVVLFDRETEQLVLRDVKTTAGDVQGFESKLAIDPQLTGYLEALRVNPPLVTLCGTPCADAGIGRVQYDVIRRAKPSEPSVNQVKKNDGLHHVTASLAEVEKNTGKNCGLVSVAKIDTTPDIYASALDLQETYRQLPRTEKQIAKLAELQAAPAIYFQRFEFNRADKNEVKRWRREVWAETSLMEKVRVGSLPPTRNQHYCTGPFAKKCKYQAVCISDTPDTRSLYVRRSEDGQDAQSGVSGGGESPAAGGIADDVGF